MRQNDLAFVRETLGLLQDAGITAWLFGGWAEEVLGLQPARPHHDLDLLYPAEDFRRVDSLFAANDDVTEIPAKHLPHKRAFARLGIMTELILVRSSPAQACFTDFWDQTHYRWPDDLLAVAVDGLRVASPAALRSYRANHHLLHGTGGYPGATL